MDRIKQHIKQLGVSNSSTILDDLEGILVANLSAKFRMLDIKRYTGVGYPHFHL